MSHFNHVANTWDSNEKILLMQDLAKKTIAKLNIQEKLSIMDFGCGTGLFGLEFSDYIHSLVGVDTSAGMLEVFNEKTKGLENISSRMLNLEYETLDLKFDLIISSMAFHHLEDPKNMIGKLRNLLNSGGQIAIVDLEKEDGSFHPDPIAMGVKHFGFTNDEIESWAQEHDMSVRISTINTKEKNEKTYDQFLAVFS
ncbi:class I SAM-dependent methyltransferase [Halobacteriovorax sp. GB3]|uniref:class I SAM-dependent DNA methyltransferase n=1 Tax=Halobacteriovorax sp. GB3 TaxID=2719615 RepID=UPI00236176AD|nr:class I SAM-dependent methyltransferase [Halobacteriovorax sp. GB3]MDD0851688.1 class I SAM-dependent methyltransferase [Halobacteriovorax sp. GB3]